MRLSHPVGSMPWLSSLAAYDDWSEAEACMVVGIVCGLKWVSLGVFALMLLLGVCANAEDAVSDCRPRAARLTIILPVTFSFEEVGVKSSVIISAVN